MMVGGATLSRIANAQIAASTPPAGPDAVVLERLMPWLKPLGGRVGVAFQAVIELMRPSPMPVMRAIVDGQVIRRATRTRPRVLEARRDLKVWMHDARLVR